LAYLHGDIVETVRSQDRAFMVEFIARHDGLFEFRAWHEVTEEDSPLGPDTYWDCDLHSGLYPSLELAQADAVGLVLWLRDHRH